jgi:hypothetical protein
MGEVQGGIASPRSIVFGAEQGLRLSALLVRRWETYSRRARTRALPRQGTHVGLFSCAPLQLQPEPFRFKELGLHHLQIWTDSQSCIRLLQNVAFQIDTGRNFNDG